MQHGLGTIIAYTLKKLQRCTWIAITHQYVSYFRGGAGVKLPLSLQTLANRYKLDSGGHCRVRSCELFQVL